MNTNTLKYKLEKQIFIVDVHSVNHQVCVMTFPNAQTVFIFVYFNLRVNICQIHSDKYKSEQTQTQRKSTQTQNIKIEIHTCKNSM